MTVANYRTKRTYHLIAFIKQKAHTHAHTCGHRHQQSGIIMHVEYAGSPVKEQLRTASRVQVCTFSHSQTCQECGFGDEFEELCFC